MKQDHEVTAWFAALPPGRQLELRKARQLKHMLDWGLFGEDKEAQLSKDYHELTGIPSSWSGCGTLDDLSDDELATLRYVSQPFGRGLSKR